MNPGNSRYVIQENLFWQGDCYTFDCVDEQKIEFCGLCQDFPCNEIMAGEKATVLNQKWLEWKRAERDSENTNPE